jgi:hypothetical protein
MTDWSFNEALLAQATKVKSLKERKSRARELMLDVVDNVLRPELEAHRRRHQVDSDRRTCLTTQPTAEEMSLFVEAWNRLALRGDCRFSLHNCYATTGSSHATPRT